MFSDHVKIPIDRIGVLIGKKGIAKKRIEKKTGTKISVNKEGLVLISSEDNLNVFITGSIIKSIGRGFNPNIAITLWNDDMSLEIIDLKDFSKSSDKKIKIIKARIIGTKGKAWKNMERLMDVHISVYGNTVPPLGKADDVIIVKGAIEKLIRGAPHGNVYKYIEVRKKISDEKGF